MYTTLWYKKNFNAFTSEGATAGDTLLLTIFSISQKQTTFDLPVTLTFDLRHSISQTFIMKVRIKYVPKFIAIGILLSEMQLFDVFPPYDPCDLDL